MAFTEPFFKGDVGETSRRRFPYRLIEMDLDTAYELHPQVAIRPEPFGALAYHYDNRRLVFLKHLDVVEVVKSLSSHPNLRATLETCGVEQSRWPSFIKALDSLRSSEILRVR